MSSKRLLGLLLIAACIMTFHASEAGVTVVRFLSYAEELKTSIALASFTGIGIFIGLLLK